MATVKQKWFVQLAVFSFFVALVVIVISMLFDSVLSDHKQDTQNDTSATNSIFGRSVYAESSTPGKKADPNYVITWPKDHAPHKDFDIEWWYLTANLNDKDGQIYGIQWTLFRFKSPNDQASTPWANDHIFMAHASLHSMDSHWFSEKFARGGLGNAGVSSESFSAFIDDWQWFNTNEQADMFPSQLVFSANQKHKDVPIKSNTRARARFNLSQTGPFVLHGKKGFSIKSGDSKHASHYYSAPFIKINGSVEFIDEANNKTSKELNGQAWFDHEWTSQLLDTTTLGWDWLSLHLDDGSKVMAFRMRLGNMPDYITGSFISSNGEQKNLYSDMLSLSPLSTTEVKGKHLPLNWSLSIPDQDIDIRVSTVKDEQYNNASVPYYEGMVNVKGSHKGVGFLEMTGY